MGTVADPIGQFAEILIEQFTNTREYGKEALALAEKYIDEMNNYIVGTVTTIPPVINIPVPGTVVVDPSLIGLIPPAPPDSSFPTAPSAPATSDHPFPGQPVYTLPDIPILTDIVLPEFIDNTVEPPTLQIPIVDFDVPAIAQIQDGGLTPEDGLVQAAKAKLMKNILSGGTMIDPQVEADIWNRELERAQQALQDAVDRITAQWAKLGWSVPDGLLAGQLLAVNNEYINKRLDASRDIAIKQAELEQQGMFKSLEIATSLEGILIASQNDYAKRVFETSKATADVTIEIFKSRIERYNTMLAAFKADVEAYKVGIDAELERAEVYKARLSGLQIIAGIDETKVKIYATEIGAFGQLVDLYKTQIQAVATMYEAEKQKIEMFKTQVDAYTSQVDAITKKYGVQVEAFKSYLSAWIASSDSQTKLIDVSVKAEIAKADAILKEWEIQLNLITENTRMKLEALKAVAQTSSNLAAGAMAAAHSAVGLTATALQSVTYTP